ncbi:MAG: NUDIX hydrolase [Candidatus Falkowbacteria bacterium]|nr:NUDIX hydrolase [Candidatus Falkowbacteria bacterium]
MNKEATSDVLREKQIRIGVAAVIVNKKGEILIAKSPKLKNNWTMPGGHLNFGEKLEEALIREVAEETGLVVAIEKMINFYEIISNDASGFHMISFHFLCSIVGSEITKLDQRELTEGRWLNPEEALPLLALDDFKKSVELFVKNNNSLSYDSR